MKAQTPRSLPNERTDAKTVGVKAEDVQSQQHFGRQGGAKDTEFHEEANVIGAVVETKPIFPLHSANWCRLTGCGNPPRRFYHMAGLFHIERHWCPIKDLALLSCGRIALKPRTNTSRTAEVQRRRSRHLRAKQYGVVDDFISIWDTLLLPKRRANDLRGLRHTRVHFLPATGMKG